MTLKTDKTWLPKAKGIATSMALLFSGSALADLTTITEHEQINLPSLMLGEVIYDHYRGNDFAALNKILIAKEQKFIPEGMSDIDILQSYMYTSFGMPRYAEELLGDLLNQDLLAKDRNETWFHKASLHYRLGERDKAIEELTNVTFDLPEEMEVERRIMLANLYVDENRFEQAKGQLQGIPVNTTMGAYANFNLAIAFIRNEQTPEAALIVQHLQSQPSNDGELLALQERAALALGLAWIQMDNYELARQALLSIRIDSPFSSQSLLAMGYANAQRNNYKQALPLWTALAERNTADTAVQEALGLVPRAYEEVGALPQALMSYRYASQAYRSELKKVEKTMLHVSQGDWLAELTPQDSASDLEDNPMASVDSYQPAATSQAAYIYNLLSSKEFVESYRRYLGLTRVQKLLENWQQGMPIYQTSLRQHQAEINILLPSLNEKITRSQAQYKNHRQRYTYLQERLNRGYSTTENILGSAGTKHQRQYKQVSKIETRLNGMPTSDPRTQQLAQRLRRVKGLLLWDMALNAGNRHHVMTDGMNSVFNAIENNESSISMLKQVQHELEQRSTHALSQRLKDLDKRVSALLTEIREAVEQEQFALENSALRGLADIRKNLSIQLADIHLSIARLQDATVSEAIASEGS